MTVSQLSSLGTSRSRRRSPPAARLARRSRSVRVVVEWLPDGTGTAPGAALGHVELLAERFDAEPRASWACIGRAWSWEEAVSTSGCAEVVLTSWPGNDTVAKDLVLDLAEHLTQRLKGSKSLVRVRFLERTKARAS